MAEKNFIKNNNFIWCFPKTFYPQGIRNNQEKLELFFKKFSTVFIRVFNNGHHGIFFIRDLKDYKDNSKDIHHLHQRIFYQGFKGFKGLLLKYIIYY